MGDGTLGRIAQKFGILEKVTTRNGSKKPRVVGRKPNRMEMRTLVFFPPPGAFVFLCLQLVGQAGVEGLEFWGEAFPEGTFQGVLAEEVHQSADNENRSNTG